MGQRLANVSWPTRVGILLLEPRKNLAELLAGRRKRDAIRKIQRTIAERKQFRAQEVGPPERVKLNRRSGERNDQPLMPTFGQSWDERCRPVVEPVVAVFGCSIDDAEEVQRGAAHNRR